MMALPDAGMEAAQIIPSTFYKPIMSPGPVEDARFTTCRLARYGPQGNDFVEVSRKDLVVNNICQLKGMNNGSRCLRKQRLEPHQYSLQLLRLLLIHTVGKAQCVAGMLTAKALNLGILRET